ncbi:MAG: hypothetical protein RIF33_09925 [Cyclobacteriaceae bacterium]
MRRSIEVKKPIQAVIVFSVLALLPALVSVVLLPVYLKELKPEEYGTLTILNLIGSFYAAVSIAQINISASTNYFDYTKEPDKLQKFKSTLFTFSLSIASATFFVFCLVGLLFFDSFTKSESIGFIPLGFMVLVTQYMAQLKSVYLVFVKNEYQLKEFIAYSVSLLFLNSSFQYYLIVVEKLGVTGSLLGAMISNIIVTVTLLIIQRRLIDFSPDKQMMKSALRLSIPFVPIILMSWLFASGDRFLLERLTNLTTVGRYAVLIGLLLLADNVFSSLGNAFRPIIFKSFQILGARELTSIRQFAALYAKFGLFTLSGVVLVGSNISIITSNEKYLSVVPLFTLGALVLLPKLILRIPYLQLMFNKDTRLIAWMTLASMVVLVVSLTAFIPSQGINGALYAIGLSNTCYLLLFYFFAQRRFPLPPMIFRDALLIIAGYLLIVGLFYLGHQTGMFPINLYGLFQFIAVTSFLLLLFFRYPNSGNKLAGVFQKSKTC